MVKAVFFDLDGVIIDSEPVHAKAKKLTLDAYGIVYPGSIFDEFTGRTDEDFFKYVSGELGARGVSPEGLGRKKNEFFIDLLPEMRLVSGFRFFFQQVKNRGLKTALVSSTSAYTLGWIDRYFDVTRLFDLLVTEKDTVYHKPHPEPYLRALDALPAAVESTIVLEDSPNGILSAKRAGCRVFAITTSFRAQRLMEADAVFANYAALSAGLGLAVK
jgi:beta-phosphoglucomutase